MKNPNLKSAQAHMSAMLEELMDAECVVLQANLDRDYTENVSHFRYHIQVLNTLELTAWIATHGYRAIYTRMTDRIRGSFPFPDGEVFYLV